MRATACACGWKRAALNATAVSAQLLHDGWLVRFAPSAAKRVRSINVLGLSTRPLDERLAYCSSLYARRGLPMLFRLTSIGPDFPWTTNWPRAAMH